VLERVTVLGWEKWFLSSIGEETVGMNSFSRLSETSPK
jgi:hypothetical protein